MTTDDVRPLIAKLTLAYGQPYGLTAASAEDLVATWRNVVGECDLRDVTAAVEQWIRTSKKWPVPAQIREDAWAIARKRRPAIDASLNSFCRRCHAVDLVELANGRFMPRHAATCDGLHETDQLDLRHALETGRPVWRNGVPPKPSLLPDLTPTGGTQPHD